MKKGKIAVYTAIFDDYDLLHEPIVNPPNYDFYCFTDKNKINSDKWNMIEIPIKNSPHLSNRKVKILPHLYLHNYDKSVYIDGNIRPLSKIDNLVDNSLEKYDIAVPKHKNRNCIYKEAKFINNTGKVNNPKALNKQIEKYKKEGYPEENGLTENNIIIRRHNKSKVIKLMNKWWSEVKSKCKRDQISLSYVSWKLGVDINTLTCHANDNIYFQRLSHKKDYKYSEYLIKLALKFYRSPKIAKTLYDKTKKIRELENIFQN
jgi:hypothetical protein